MSFLSRGGWFPWAMVGLWVLSLWGWSATLKSKYELAAQSQADQERLIQINLSLLDALERAQTAQKLLRDTDTLQTAQKAAVEALVRSQGHSFKDAKLNAEHLKQHLKQDAIDSGAVTAAVTTEFCLFYSAVRNANRAVTGTQDVPTELPAACTGSP